MDKSGNVGSSMLETISHIASVESHSPVPQFMFLKNYFCLPPAVVTKARNCADANEEFE